MYYLCCISVSHPVFLSIVDDKANGRVVKLSLLRECTTYSLPQLEHIIFSSFVQTSLQFQRVLHKFYYRLGILFLMENHNLTCSFGNALPVVYRRFDILFLVL